MTNGLIKTSESGWFKTLTEAYKNRHPVTLIDDANIGIDPSDQSLISMGLKAKLSPADWTAVGVSVGLGAAGIWVIIAAIADPEPTSKLGLLVAGGFICTLGGGFTAVKILTKQRPPSVKLGPMGFEISW